MRIKNILILSTLILSLSSCKRENEEVGNSCIHTYTKELVEPTCHDKGYTINTCSKCNDSFNDSYVEPTGHQYYRVHKVDETGDVYFELTCRKCGNKSKEELDTQPNDLYGYKDLERFQNKNNLKDFYISIIMTCDEFKKSDIDLEKESVVIANKEESYYIIDKIEYASYNLNINEALAVMNLINLDNPKYYFLSNSVIYDDNYIYLVTYSECAKETNRIAIEEKVESMSDRCKTIVENAKSDEEIVRIIHDYLITEMEYAYILGTTNPETNDWAHTIVGASKYKKGVCEAYSKMFKYICDDLGIECLIVEGEANVEAHSWNIVKLNDSWYGIDVTFDDQGQISYDYYLMSVNEMNGVYEQYSSLSLTNNYVYLTPSISTEGYNNQN